MSKTPGKERPWFPTPEGVAEEKRIKVAESPGDAGHLPELKRTPRFQHRVRSFQEEFADLLRFAGVPFEPEFLD
ncbi:hypothetical protein OP10G_0863 [Fimbriimonas ginsengisoli Gsoil 348]|uniref:Uncharacterized protein n=1 Tax=Fimbriimonas ginsengisoli Gsoil 348 TaxID=661478 RepID=A0A068NL76_FIMGI|nr:hypothetical protein OP10G_0863 [Fimbriimonas ginsengisoli Gsoil 348]